MEYKDIGRLDSMETLTLIVLISKLVNLTNTIRSHTNTDVTCPLEP